MTATYTEFTEQYASLQQDLSNLISKYSIPKECPSCHTQLFISQFHIINEWNCISINTRGYCSTCYESRNYTTIVR